MTRKYTSHSELWMYATDPAAWHLRYNMNVRGSTNANMARGNAVEHGLELLLTDEFGTVTEETAIEAAVKSFNKETALLVQRDDREKAAEQIPGFITEAVKAFEPFGKCISTQNRLEIDLGVGLPILGFDDFEFDGEPKLSIDLKTTTRIPSVLPDMAMQQASIYQAMRPDHKIIFVYVSPKKSQVFEINKADTIEVLESVKMRAKAMQTMRGLSNDPKEIATLFAPSYSSFYWNDPIMRSEAKRIFGV